VNKTKAFIVCLAAALCSLLYAVEPGWWTASGITNTTGDRAEGRSAATVGQLKYIATKAREHIDAVIGNAISRADWNAAFGGKDPFPLQATGENTAPATVGQAKFLLDGLYNAMIAENVDTNFLLLQNNLAWAESKPWAPIDDSLENSHPITVAQLKFAFSFDLNLDTDSDGMLDIVEIQIINADLGDAINTLGDVLTSDDFDGDGLINANELAGVFNPVKKDHPAVGLKIFTRLE